MTRTEKIMAECEKHKKEDMALYGVNNESSGEYYLCDSLNTLPKIMRRYEGKIQLIYMDPPFVTGKVFGFKQKIGQRGWENDRGYVINHTAYDDRWKKGKEEYLMMMRQILKQAHRLLSPEGALYLHVDYRTSSYLRILLDELFGEENFINEIIWHYQSGGRARNHFSRKHDNILFYRKSSNYYFNLEATGKPRGKDKRNHMKQQVDENGRVFWSIKSGNKIYKYYEDMKVYPSDVWDDISHLQQRDPERTGYDTQKPEALLDRIIKASSRQGDIVADFFAGSGTTLAVAHKLGRKWIGMDNSPFSLHVCRKRILQAGGSGEVIFHYREQEQLSASDDDVKIELKETGDGRRAIYLHCYNPVVPEEFGLDNLNVCDCDLVDYWAAGYMVDKEFIPLDYSMRCSQCPSLRPYLTVPMREKQRVVVHIVDVFGNQNFYEVG